MSTVNQHLSNIRGLIKKHTRSEGIYTDQFLLQLLNGARATFISQQLSKLNNISDFNYQKFDIKLELVNDTICDSTVGCKALKSVTKIPRSITSSRKSMEMVFYTLGKQRVTIVRPDRWDIYKDDEFKKYIGSIINDYLYIWNDKNLKCISAYGILEDPTELVECCNDEPCYDITTSEYPLDENTKIAIYTEVLKLLRVPLELPSDNTNDSNNET